MKITELDIDELTKKMTLTVEKEDYMPRYEKEIKAIKKFMYVPGFRRGKAPDDLINKKYGNEIIEEAVFSVSNEKVASIIKERNWENRLVGRPHRLTSTLIVDKNATSYDVEYLIGLHSLTEDKVKDSLPVMPEIVPSEDDMRRTRITFLTNLYIGSREEKTELEHLDKVEPPCCVLAIRIKEDEIQGKKPSELDNVHYVPMMFKIPFENMPYLIESNLVGKEKNFHFRTDGYTLFRDPLKLFLYEGVPISRVREALEAKYIVLITDIIRSKGERLSDDLLKHLKDDLSRLFNRDIDVSHEDFDKLLLNQLIDDWSYYRNMSFINALIKNIIERHSPVVSDNYISTAFSEFSSEDNKKVLLRVIIREILTDMLIDDSKIREIYKRMASTLIRQDKKHIRKLRSSLKKMNMG